MIEANNSKSKLPAAKVVVLVPSYNPGKYLVESVRSLLDQIPDVPQIVVIDDGCTDGSIEMLRQWEEASLIEIIRNPRNQGKSVSLNRAFAAYEAEFFVLQDADDISKPNRIARQVAFMRENPDVGCSSSFVDYISSNGNYIAEGKLDILDDTRLAEYLRGDEPLGLYCPAIILRSTVAKDPQLGFRKEFWPADDIDLWNRIAEKGHKVRAQPENLVGYRVHGASAVTSGFTKTRMQFEWVRACLRSRRLGLPEPTREEFLHSWRTTPFLKRVNRSRKFLAKGFYRSAGFSAAEGDYLKASSSAIMAILLQPMYSVRRGFDQLRKRFI